jgi:hypothetical protein
MCSVVNTDETAAMASRDTEQLLCRNSRGTHARIHTDVHSCVVSRVTMREVFYIHTCTFGVGDKCISVFVRVYARKNTDWDMCVRSKRLIITHSFKKETDRERKRETDASNLHNYLSSNTSTNLVI